MNATSPEVSAFALSEDKRLLIIGTASTEAKSDCLGDQHQRKVIAPRSSELLPYPVP